MEKAIDESWDAYDLNKDGFLEKNEANNFYTSFVLGDKRFKKVALPFEEWFEQMDNDKDDRVSKKEVAMFLEKLAANPSVHTHVTYRKPNK